MDTWFHLSDRFKKFYAKFNDISCTLNSEVFNSLFSIWQKVYKLKSEGRVIQSAHSLPLGTLGFPEDKSLQVFSFLLVSPKKTINATNGHLYLRVCWFSRPFIFWIHLEKNDKEINNALPPSICYINSKWVTITLNESCLPLKNLGDEIMIHKKRGFKN